MLKSNSSIHVTCEPSCLVDYMLCCWKTVHDCWFISIMIVYDCDFDFFFFVMSSWHQVTCLILSSRIMTGLAMRR